VEQVNWAELLTPILQALAVVIGGFVVNVLRKLAAKYKVEISEATEAHMRQKAEEIALALEERAARAYLDKGTEGLSRMRAAFGGHDEDALQLKLDAALPRVGVGAAVKRQQQEAAVKTVPAAS